MESSGHGGGGDGDLARLVSVISLVELLISSIDLSFVIQLMTTMNKKELVHAFSCAYIELWMHLGSLESTHKARVALSCASSNS